MMTLEKFEEASELVKRVTNPTKLIRSEYLSEQTGGKVYLKPENMQHTGAYKIRGAYYKISTMTEEERSRGLITASAGNHAQGVAFAAKKFGCKAVIVMPTVTPLIKVNRTKSYGAEVVLYGDVYDDSYAYACELAEKEGYTFVHPFNDLDVATGQGTIAMEIVQELPTVDYILVPVGGGGLISGVSTLAKMLNPKIKVIGAEPAEAASMTAALKAGEVVELDGANTIADGTAVKAVGDKILPYVQENVDDMLLVEDDELIGAFLDMGLEKDVLLPFKEQTHPVRKGEHCLVTLYVDKSGRLAATMRVYSHMRSDSPYKEGDWVEGVAYEVKEGLGAFVAVDNRYYGLVPSREMFGTVREGDRIRARVTQVRADGKLDLSLRDKAYRQMESDSERILKVMEEFDGVLPFTDKADPQIILREFHMSKNAFKRAVGRLLKEGKVRITEKTIERVEAGKGDSKGAWKDKRSS